MRKNKGYQLDTCNGWRRGEGKISHAEGKNKTPEQILEDVEERFDYRVRNCQKEYERIAKKTTLIGEELRKYCRDLMLYEVRFDDKCNLIPLEEALAMLEKDRQRCLESKLYGKYSAYQKRIIHKDNQKFVYNSGNGPDGSRHQVRVPSMKRSNATWKRFYELFPCYKEHYDEWNNKDGLKLKKVW